MRIRQLNSSLKADNLVFSTNLEDLRGKRVGMDAAWWLRCVQMLKDPYADPVGGLPPGLYSVIDRELALFKKYDIKPLFVFEGAVPAVPHQMFQQNSTKETDDGWEYAVKGAASDAQKSFAIATSRLNQDICHFVFHHMKTRNVECMRAPYFTSNQLAHFVKVDIVDAVFGPPGLLLYDIPVVIIDLDFSTHSIDYVIRDVVLAAWDVDKDQLLDACLLAGTEYCLTYPYLNLELAGQNMNAGSFNFNHVLSLVRHQPLMYWMNTFPTADMRDDHIKGYCVTKALMKHGQILDTSTYTITSLYKKDDMLPMMPEDFDKFVGHNLAPIIYVLVCYGVVSSRLLYPLTHGEWNEKHYAPLIDSEDSRLLLMSLEPHRQLSTGLIGCLLHEDYLKEPIIFKPYWYDENQESESTKNRSKSNVDELVDKDHIENDEADTVVSDGDSQILKFYAKIPSLLHWQFSSTDIDEELVRQGVDIVDFKFCLDWHQRRSQNNSDNGMVNITRTKAYIHYRNREYGNVLAEIPGEAAEATVDYLNTDSSPDKSHSVSLLSTDKKKETLCALFHFRFLEVLGYLSPVTGEPTILGEQLRKAPRPLTNSMFIFLEFAKLGFISGDLFDEVPQRPFPQGVKYGADENDETRATRLLLRVFSLVPMKFKTELWNSSVDFDLSMFHSLVRILLRSLRGVCESVVSHTVIEEPSWLKHVTVPNNLYSPSTPVPIDYNWDTETMLPKMAKIEHSATVIGETNLMPSFAFPSCCLGIVLSYVLNYENSSFEDDVVKQFPCAVDPIIDIRIGFTFWNHIVSTMQILHSNNLASLNLLKDFNLADSLLKTRMEKMGITPMI